MYKFAVGDASITIVLEERCASELALDKFDFVKAIASQVKGAIAKIVVLKYKYVFRVLGVPPELEIKN